MPKISVIIPVYKAEPYIERCVRSLFSQTLDDLEYIFIDDCTPDNSISVLKAVLDEYPNRRDQVKIVNHQHNQGVSQSRQDGFDATTGEYVIHCDPDDWIEPEMYELLYDKAKSGNFDIVGCDFWEEFDNKSTTKLQEFSLTPKDIFVAILDGDLHPSLWSRLIRRQFIIENNVVFDPDICLSEDANYVFPLHLASERVAWLHQPLYHYRMAADRITHRIGEKQIFSHIKVIKSISEYCPKEERVITAYNSAKARAVQALITNLKVYNPQQWLAETAGLPYSFFGAIKHRISPWLIRHGFFKLNKCFVWLFRLIS